MKMLLTIALALVLILSLTACDNDRVSQEEYDRLLREREQLLQDANNGSDISHDSSVTDNVPSSVGGNTRHSISIGETSGIYEGNLDIKGGIPDGWGVWMYDNCRYEGYFKNGMPNGEGTLYEAYSSSNGPRVDVTKQGIWVDGFGEGTMIETHLEAAFHHIRWTYEVSGGYPVNEGRLEGIRPDTGEGCGAFKILDPSIRDASVPPWDGNIYENPETSIWDGYTG